jgi:hypothetical protein
MMSSIAAGSIPDSSTSLRATVAAISSGPRLGQIPLAREVEGGAAIGRDHHVGHA